MNAKLWAHDPSAAAQAVQRHFPHETQLTILRAQEICEQTFVFQDHWEMERTVQPVCFEGPIDWEYIPAGDPEWTYALNRHTIFVNLGKAWRFTHDAVFADRFALQMADWLRRVPHTPESERTTWRALEAGLRCENWLRALRLFENADLSPALLRDIDASLREHGAHLLHAHGAFQKLSNWGALQDHGLFLLGLHFQDEAWCRTALRRLDENLQNALLADGVHWEQSPLYHCEVLHATADALLNARQNGVAVPSQLEVNIRRMFVALEQWIKPDGRLLCQSDSDGIDARGLLAQGALLFGGAQPYAGALLEENLWDFGPDAFAAYAALPPPQQKPASAALAASGNYMLRSDGPDPVFLHLHGGSLGGGHGHADLLHIDLWHKGEDILRDAGRFTYVESTVRRRLKRPAAHNTLRVDRRDFISYQDTWGWADLATPLPAEYAFHPDAGYLCAGHLGYGWPVQRKIVHLKPGFFLIADLCWCQGSHTVEQYFHFGPGALTVEGFTAHWQGTHTRAQLSFLYAPSITQQETEFSPDYNTLKTAPALRLQTCVAGLCPLLTVACVGAPFTVRLLPVSTAVGQILTPQAAQAVEIEQEGRKLAILLTHTAGPHDAALLCASGYTGHGRVLVFTPEHPDGICLAR